MIRLPKHVFFNAVALLVLAALGTTCRAADEHAENQTKLIARLRALTANEGRFGPAYQAVYHAALPWYEAWGVNSRNGVDDWMVPPDTYAAELADALEKGRNYFAESPNGLLPLCFAGKTADGKAMKVNYWISLPTGFAGGDKKFPLVISLHGTGWLGHRLSFVRQSTKIPATRPAIMVTPIDEGGPWSLEFLNAYLDELIRVLPVDADRVYVDGHSLGAMATWEWALHNPERFAAISPHSGMGEPLRAVRLKHVPAWVIHGENDDAVPAGFSDQMVTAMQASGASVRYSILPGVGHNMPDDLDGGQILDWYLHQTRSHEPAPADPLDRLGLNAEGFSPWEIISVPAGYYWSSGTATLTDRGASLREVRGLFDKARARGELADAPIVLKLDPKTQAVSFSLEVPKTLRTGAKPDATATAMPASRCLRFYFRGEMPKGFAHLEEIRAEVGRAGHALSDDLRVIPITLWQGTPSGLAEYRVTLK
jgi:predicted esterase